ncbi:integrase, catalytic region, zinc finger, CCHC-type containing protein [Tanacetum coccineum]|uniref:Integrase, catalytic region, zinc finger, CCHC-type containing protein n=1 Tax=Tanacetum coccineum TaxID=301880 RepID=A0ABQ5BWJ8_9ASTR
MWKAIGKLVTNVGYQWKPMGRIFTLREQCPLTRLTKSKVVPTKQTKNVSTSKIMITEKRIHTSQKPLTRYQRRTKQYKAIPTSIPTLTKNETIDASWHSTISSANQQELNKNWGSIFSNYPSSSIFKCRTVRFGNDHFGSIIGYGDYVIGDSVISRVYYMEGLGHNLFSIGQFYDFDLEVAFKKHSCYVRDTYGVELIKVLRTPQQNGVVKRWNHTLVEAARTMLIFSMAPMFLWAEVVAIAYYTQNRSLIRTRYNKTPYELVHDRKPDLTFSESLVLFVTLRMTARILENNNQLLILEFSLVMHRVGRVIESTTKEPDE